ncbi:MAG: DUF4124 domain-containing protein [Desulforhopalus sp.]
MIIRVLSCFTSILAAIIFSSATAHGAMYQWTDKNGNIQFSNVAPPSSIKGVVASEETYEDPESRLIRLKQKAIDREIAAEKKRQHEEQLKLQRARDRRLAEIRRQEEAAFRRSRPDLFPPKQKINMEEDRLAKNEKKAIARCEVDTGQGYLRRRDCRERVFKKYKARRAFLENDPAGYFAKREHRSSTARSRRSIDGDERQPETIINSQTGEVLYRSGSGYVGSYNGTFYTGAPGGIVNTENGEFSPVN